VVTASAGLGVAEAKVRVGATVVGPGVGGVGDERGVEDGATVGEGLADEATGDGGPGGITEGVD
jgi:hypothetical protein